MTRAEIQDLLAMIQGAYPNYNPQNKTATVNAWLIALEDMDKNVIAMAFKNYLRTNSSGFAPAPGQLMAMAQEITSPQELTEMEAWAIVSRAIRNSTYGFLDEYAKLPPLVQKAVGLPSQLREWALDEHINMQVVASNFMRTYKTVVDREKEVSKMSPDVRKIIQNACDSSYKAELEDKRQRMIKSSTDEENALKTALESKESYIPMPEKYRRQK